MDAFFASAQQHVTGTVGLRLYKGNVAVTSRQSPHSLYRTDLASFSMARYNPKDAEGFINLFALPVTVPAERLRHREAAGNNCGSEQTLGWKIRSAARRALLSISTLLSVRPPSAALRTGRRPRVGSRHRKSRASSLPRKRSRHSTAIDAIAERAESDPAWLDLSPAEDVHHFVEMALVETLRPVGLQAAHRREAGMNWWPRISACSSKKPRRTSRRAVSALIAALIGLAERTMGVPLAGMTHLATCAANSFLAFYSRAC